MNNKYKVTHVSYSGMPVPLGAGFTWREAFARAKRRIAYFKEKYRGSVTRLGKGLKSSSSSAQWELMEPESCVMVPDACGFLTIQKEKSNE